MPDILVLANRATAEKLESVFDSISWYLRVATAKSFKDLENDPMKVAAMLIPYIAGSNAPRIQTIGIANYNPVRETELVVWKNNLIIAWQQDIVPRMGIEFQDMLVLKGIEVWPLLPIGIWDFVPPATR